MMEFIAYVPTIYGALALAISLVDGLHKWAAGEFANSGLLNPVAERRITDVLGSIAAVLRAIYAGMSAFNNRRRR